MKKNKNLLFLIFTVFFLVLTSITSGSTTVSASSFPKLQTISASSGKFITDGTHWMYQYKNKKIAKGEFLRINKKTYYLNKAGYRWSGMHEVGGKKYCFGTKSQGYLYHSKLFRYRNNYYYADRYGVLVTGWYTLPSGKTYFFDTSGKAITGKKRIKNVNYYFSQNGELHHSGLNYNLSSDCALLINADTGKVLYAKNENVPHANASTTKIMTCILALENSNLNDVVKFSSYATSMEPTKLYAKKGETFYMRHLLYSLMVPSHNDTAVAIAEHISGSTSKFVNLMNQKAAQIGCTNTHFATPNGLDKGLNHYTTASDLAKIATYALKYPAFRTLISTQKRSFRSINTKRRFTVTTTNALLGNMPGVQGMKTGYTDKAGHCFVGLSKSAKGNTYISVVLGGKTSQSRWKDSRILLNYAYKH